MKKPSRRLFFYQQELHNSNLRDVVLAGVVRQVVGLFERLLTESIVGDA